MACGMKNDGKNLKLLLVQIVGHCEIMHAKYSGLISFREVFSEQLGDVGLFRLTLIICTNH